MTPSGARGADTLTVLTVLTVLAELERLLPLILAWAMARDVTHAVRGGRVPAWAGPVVRATGLTPIAKFTPDGRLAVAGG